MTKSYVDKKNLKVCNYKKPLVYNGVSDLSILPIDKDGLGVCPQCGAVAIKHAYNRKLSKFCSLKCSRRFTASESNNNGTHEFKLMGPSDHLVGMIPMEPIPQLDSPWPAILDDLMQPSPTKTPLVASSYEWSSELFGCDFLAAPVKLFKHAPLSSMWDDTYEGMKVEVRNMDCYSDRQSDFFWVATVIKVKGYMALLRYEGFGSDDSRDFWLNLCCSEVHPVGWCATRGKPLIPPASIEDKYSDWKRFLVRQLTGARTLPADFYSKLSDGLKSRFKIGTVMEVVDKNRISQVKVASIYEIVGNRLHVKYYDTCPEDHGFWCHEDSPLIHPVGWAFTVGHVLDATPDYCERVASGIFESTDATPDMFYHPEMEEGVELFQDGQKLEAIDPLNLSSVCAATVMRVLHDGFMMIRIDCYPADVSGADWFCYHQRSPCIFPVGFTKANNIPLIPPAGYNARTFEWSSYLEETQAVAAGPELFPPRSAALHGFVSGMRLECSDLMDPRLVCVATIARVIGNLLKIHFDGWGEEYDQWLSGDSTDIYPVGWCRAVGHRLEGPLRPTPAPRAPRRPRAYKRKRNQTSLASGQPHSPFVPPVSESTSNESTQPSDDTRVSGSVADDVTCVEGVDSLESGVTVDSQHNQHSQHSSQSSTTQSSSDVPPSESHDDEQAAEILSSQDQTVSNESTSCVKDKEIPRIVGKSNISPETLRSMEPDKWSAAEVAEFLKVNDWSAYCVNFQEVDGSRFLNLTKDKIIELLEMKVGPSLKIFDLIQQLKSKVKPTQNRRKTIFK